MPADVYLKTTNYRLGPVLAPGSCEPHSATVSARPAAHPRQYSVTSLRWPGHRREAQMRGLLTLPFAPGGARASPD
jgi:hypothetical protein